MSTAADQLLDGMMTAAEDGQPTDDRIILSIDEPSRTIKYDGELILGVKGDRFAERIYFRCPLQVYKEESRVIDLTLPTTKIYIDYKNAYNETYIEECFKHGLENDKYIFSWFVSDHVTPKDGTISFNVCIKDESEDLKDNENNIIIKEWHTTTFKGIVLPAVDVSSNTPEVITSDTITSTAIIEAMNSYEVAFKELNETLSDVNDYIDSQISEELDSYIISIARLSTDSSFSTDFDFSAITVDNIYDHVCIVIDEKSETPDLQNRLLPVNYEFTDTYNAIYFSNGVMSLQCIYNIENNTVNIIEDDIPVATALYADTANTAYTAVIANSATVSEQIKQITASSSYIHSYPILCSSNEEYRPESVPGYYDVLRTANVTITPSVGEVYAVNYREDGVYLKDKYVRNPNYLLETSPLNITSYEENLEYESDSASYKSYVQCEFDGWDHSKITTVLPKAKYIMFTSTNSEGSITSQIRVSIDGYYKEYDNINNYQISINGQYYNGNNWKKIDVQIYCSRSNETYNTLLILRSPDKRAYFPNLDPANVDEDYQHSVTILYS